ncbi:MAG: site-2 protease family protein [Candidatus Micrarchaeota archaeon]|nr:site-2 protease family protein [Candidatus Micrarchaeota archaeon]
MQSGEMIDIIVSVLALAFAFSISRLEFFPIILLTVGVGFVAHELAHRFVANHYGAKAFYRAWPEGLLFMFATAAITGGKFLFAAPGAVYIYSTYLSKRENGIISISGAVMNFLLAIFFLFVAVAIGVGGTPKADMLAESFISFGTYMNLYLAFFNMIPIPPLDGSKVIAWSFPVWAAFMLILVILVFGIF